MLIRLLLIAAVLLLCFYFVRTAKSARTLALRRIAGICFALAWIVAVLVPDAVTKAARVVGVGRGTDLLVYFLVVAMLLLAISQFQRIAQLEAKLTKLARELALRTVEDTVAPDELSANRQHSPDDPCK